MAALTTNDVRVLRLLVAHGPLTEHEIGMELCYGLGWEPAQRRMVPLAERDLISRRTLRRGQVFDATSVGVRALAAADRAAYGAFA